MLDDYLLSYLDASVTEPTGINTSQHSRSPITKGAGDASLDSQLTGSQAPAAAAVWLKAQAVKALAAGCVPDSDSHDVPLETMRAVARLAQTFEGCGSRVSEPGLLTAAAMRNIKWAMAYQLMSLHELCMSESSEKPCLSQRTATADKS